jgi:thiosulfate dehydrogenase [quinone] large subunit
MAGFAVVPTPMEGTMASDTAYSTATPVDDVEPGSAFGRTMMAILRIVAGFYFFWAFLDKLFGLGYSTASDRAWINGGSPTAGFLGSRHVGPFASMYRSMAGNSFLDWLFMLGLLGIGVALIVGAGMWIGAVGGVVMLLMMWTAVWPMARFNDSGAPTGSANPIVDDHIILALVLLVLAAYHAGNTFGLGRWWTSLGFVQKNRWLT